MNKVYVLMYDMGSWDDYSKEIYNIYSNKEDAVVDKIKLEENNNLIKNKYTYEEIEKYDEELLSYNIGNMPSYLKEFQRWYCEDKYNKFWIDEYELR